MSRIRSVHPGLWTDERFASLSLMARLLFIGIWTECDDQGSFEWSPLKLKMRILPADSADVGALLAEMEVAGCVIGYELDGRKLGAVRNFCRFQRPKKPNSTYPQTDEVRDFVGTEARSTRDGSEPVPNQSGKVPPDGGWRMEDGGGRPSGKIREVGGAAKRGTRLPDDFAVPAEWLAWSTSEGGLAKDAAAIEAASFVDYWHAKPGRDGVKTDWQATWRNWVRRSDRGGVGTTGRPRRDPGGGFEIGGVRMSSPC